MKERYKLDDSDLYITADRTIKERETQKKIMAFASEEEQKGSRVKVRHLKLTINGETKVWQEGVGLVLLGRRHSQSPRPGSGLLPLDGPASTFLLGSKTHCT